MFKLEHQAIILYNFHLLFFLSRPENFQIKLNWHS